MIVVIGDCLSRRASASTQSKDTELLILFSDAKKLELIFNKRATMPIGSNFDDFLKEEGLHEQSTAAALKKVLALQIEEGMKTSSSPKPPWPNACTPAAQR